MGSCISRKSIVELSPAARNLTDVRNLKGTIQIFLRTKRFSEINNGVLNQPVSELYPTWRRAMFEFLSLRAERRIRNRIGLFAELSEAFFKAYAVQSATEFWAPSLTAVQLARSAGDGARRYYEWLCRRDGIDSMDAGAKPEDSAVFLPLRMDYVPLDLGLVNLLYSTNKTADHLDKNFRPVFCLLSDAARSGPIDFDRQMRKVERGDTDVQSRLHATQRVFVTMLRQDLAYRAVRAHLPFDEQNAFDDCVRLNEQFSIMNDLHGGFALFNADVAKATVSRMLLRCDASGRSEVLAAGWCWRQVGTLYRLMEEGRFKRRLKP